MCIGAPRLRSTHAAPNVVRLHPNSIPQVSPRRGYTTWAPAAERPTATVRGRHPTGASLAAPAARRRSRSGSADGRSGGSGGASPRSNAPLTTPSAVCKPAAMKSAPSGYAPSPRPLELEPEGSPVHKGPTHQFFHSQKQKQLQGRAAGEAPADAQTRSAALNVSGPGHVGRRPPAVSSNPRAKTQPPTFTYKPISPTYKPILL